MTVASLELCKELEKLSGWKSEWMYWKKLIDDNSQAKVLRYGAVTTRDGAMICFAYSLDYLLRKLPDRIQDGLDTFYLFFQKSPDGYIFSFSKVQNSLATRNIVTAPTPEDAAAKLCIALFEQDILPRKDELQ